MIKLKLHSSTLATILILVSIGTLFIIYTYLPQLKSLILTLMILITIFWILRLLFIPQYTLNIYRKPPQINLCYNDNVEAIKLTKHIEITFMLTILYLKSEQRRFIIPIFIDSSTIKDYKQLKTYLRWG